MHYRQHDPMRPMLATPGPQPAGLEWLHEVKWDGMRVLVERLHLATEQASRDLTGMHRKQRDAADEGRAHVCPARQGRQHQVGAHFVVDPGEPLGR